MDCIGQVNTAALRPQSISLCCLWLSTQPGLQSLHFSCINVVGVGLVSAGCWCESWYVKLCKLPVRHKSSKLRSSVGDRDGRSGGGQQGRAARAAGGTGLDAPAGLKQTDNWIKQYQHQHCHSLLLVCIRGNNSV